MDGAHMPLCNAGQGNFYQFDTFPRVTAAGTNQFPTIQTLGQPAGAHWVIKFGVRYKFSAATIWGPRWNGAGGGSSEPAFFSRGLPI